MLQLLVALLITNNAIADTAQDDRRVNHHMQRTQTKLQIEREKTALDNKKLAPPLRRSPTYQDPTAFRSYGVEMPKANPFESLELDHLEEEDPDPIAGSN